ncbi:MAG: phosphoribosyltransferase family protein [bacterium]
MSIYRNRKEAGRRLAEGLERFRGEEDLIVLGLPRGGVPVACEVAEALGAPLDVFLVRKLGVPGREELAMGAIASGGVQVLNEEIARDVEEDARERVLEKEREELRRREEAYRGEREELDLEGRTALVVDDGLATGASMKAALEGVRASDPKKIVAAVPVGPPETVEELRSLADEVVCPETPRMFGGIGQFYQDFSQTTDEEVRESMERAAGP